MTQEQIICWAIVWVLSLVFVGIACFVLGYESGRSDTTQGVPTCKNYCQNCGRKVVDE